MLGNAPDHRNGYNALWTSFASIPPCSGIFDYVEDRDLFSTDWMMPCTPRQIVDGVTTRHDPYFVPDGEFHYSNTNYILLGMILEVATGQSVGTVLHARAIDAAELPATFLDGFDPIDPSRMARGFHGFTDYDWTFRLDPSCLWTAGAMVTSGADLADWVFTLYGSNTILEPTQRDLLTSKTSDFYPYAFARYGLGVELYDESVWYAQISDLRPQELPTRPHPGPGIGHSAARWDS